MVIRKRPALDLPLLLSLIIFGFSIFDSGFWFFLPIASFVLFQANFKPLRWVPLAVSLAWIPVFRIQPWTELDLLALYLLTGMGLFLVFLKVQKLNYLHYMSFIVTVAIGSAFALMAVSTQLADPAWKEWLRRLTQSHIFPYFFREAIWVDQMAAIYESVLLPILIRGFFAWFGTVMAMAFFVNAVLRNVIVKAPYALRARVDRNAWAEFHYWRAPDGFIVPLVLGLACLVLSFQFEWSERVENVLQIIGWNVSLLSALPLVIHGVALTSFFMARLSLFMRLMIIFLLFVLPLPSLMVAGILDLLFDFRARFGSNPEDS